MVHDWRHGLGMIRVLWQGARRALLSQSAGESTFLEGRFFLTGRVSQPRPRRSSLLNLMQVIFARCTVDSASGIPRSNVHMINNKTAGDKDSPSTHGFCGVLCQLERQVGKRHDETVSSLPPLSHAQRLGTVRYGAVCTYIQYCARQSRAGLTS